MQDPRPAPAAAEAVYSNPEAVYSNPEALYSNKEVPMDPQSQRPVTPDGPKQDNQLPAYTPGFGRRLLMFLLCLLGLIVVWTFVWLDLGKK